MASRLQEVLDRGDVATGVLITSPSGEFVQTLGSAGFDYVLIDGMYGSISWSDAAEMTRAARLAGITPLIRLATEPWTVPDNRQVAVDAGRAMSIGAEGVAFSVTSAREAREVVEVAGGWHRELQTIPWTREEFEAHAERMREETFVAGVIESSAGLEALDEIAAVPGLDSLMAATTDGAIMLGHGVNSEHPEVWDFVDRVAEACDRNEIAMWNNTGMGYSTFPDMKMRAEHLIEHGSKMLLFQTAELLLQMAGKEVLTSVREKVPA